MSTERLQILRMLEEGKISAEEASNLLEAIDAPAPAPLAATEKRSSSGGMARWLRIEVKEKNGNVVNLKLPLFVIRAALRFGGRFNIGGFNMEDFGPEAQEALDEALQAGQTGLLVDVTDDDGDHVHIYLD